MAKKQNNVEIKERKSIRNVAIFYKGDKVNVEIKERKSIRNFYIAR